MKKTIIILCLLLPIASFAQTRDSTKTTTTEGTQIVPAAKDTITDETKLLSINDLNAFDIASKKLFSYEDFTKLSVHDVLFYLLQWKMKTMNAAVQPTPSNPAIKPKARKN